MTDNAPVERDAPASARPRYAWAIVLEAVLCFALPCIALTVGLFYLPLLLVGLVRGGYTSGLFYWLIAPIVLGWSGVAGVARVLWLLCARRPTFLRRWLTLLTLACGVTVSLVLWGWIALHPTSEDWGWLIGMVFLPLACTAHLVYLARRRLFA